MNKENSGISSKFDKAMNPEQIDRVVEAILAGKYSWACVLMLRFAGYNPLHYIPYRTYNRLLKENSSGDKSQQQSNDNSRMNKSAHEKRSDANLSPSCLSKIKDLAYLEVVGKQKREIHGGNLDEWLSAQISETQQIKSDLQSESDQYIGVKLCDFN
ncbi:HetP family heterocyst commitment protein [Calothrix sp. UHCC 0171]|uniref:HetP family heterocyst commitment protein n=1 Tax=Calothrix sp. UHCC 0171 TaxID=3110245 RepID=UPI002B21BA08|nr:HetP family heterocyst commitment protein [Calothrix sp. UHCC 0171]MEA5570921.1 HetP family heterocyst commitment protein [Calothrix sp. UHCC 0171]